MTVRQKIFAYMGLLVLIISVSHAIITQVYNGHLFEQFQKTQIDANYLSAPISEQIETLKAYVIGNTLPIAILKAFTLMIIGLFFSFWMSGVLTQPLKKLVAAIERVAQGELNVQIPVHTEDEYGKVIRTFNDMTDRLNQTEEVRRRLMADVAHELRTPLSIIQLKLENAQQAGHLLPLEAQLQLHDEVIRLSLLVEDLHVLSLAEAGRLSLNCQLLDLKALLAQIIEDVNHEAEENGLMVMLSSKPGPVAILADARRLTQVFINLLTNAIRYTAAGGEIVVEIGDPVTLLEVIYTCVSVRDNGMGIPAEELPHLFDRFYRVEEARTRHSGGSGLGLSIAEQFVKAHGGYIRVKSQLNEGTTFTVYLPETSPI